MLVGPTISDIKSVYVSIATLLFKVDGVVEGLDVIFKSFHSLHTSYPQESSHIWITIQRGIYGFQTEWDASNGVNYSWIKAYKTQRKKVKVPCSYIIFNF